ncbi:metallophosphoesterase family protein [Adlercreutzia murintestinalis]|uniref:metallophosphoesterase family protein n=1 Tax=Adlercreutzia murintestinalis TaxID=2941325 RepID=UPI00203CFD66|nr:metallophosphoesterase family protein [Adlercreutzia murintestinalis]
MAQKRIGVISDTHGPLPAEAFDLFNGEWSAERLAEAAVKRYEVTYDAEGRATLRDVWPESAPDVRACDLILHAGDIGVQSALDELGAICRTVAVLGNNDRAAFWDSDGGVGDLRSLTFDGIDIAMMHIPTDLRIALHGRPPTVVAAVKEMPQLAVHGHTHVPEVRLDGDTVVLCPGSPTRSRSGSGHNAALVDIEDGRVADVYIIRLP